MVFGVRLLRARIRDKGVNHLHKRTTSDGQGGLLLSNNSFRRSRGPFDQAVLKGFTILYRKEMIEKIKLFGELFKHL